MQKHNQLPDSRIHETIGINSNFHSRYTLPPPLCALCTRGKSRNFIKEAYPENERAIIEWKEVQRAVGDGD